MSVLFLTGATVTFKPLLDHIVEPLFLQFLQKQGFNDISIQYGNEISNGKHISKEYFSELLSRNDVISQLDLQITNETNDKSITTLSNETLKLTVFPFSSDITSHIENSDLVVSHGGTGSILDALRLNKPLLVVTNDLLMDNHQVEVAEQFEMENHLKSFTCKDLKKGDLERAIEEFKKGNLEFKSLEKPPNGILQSLISQVTN